MPRPPRRLAAHYRPDEIALLDQLRSPADVQAFLDGIAYSTDPIYRSPRGVMHERKAHCFDGALFAAAALEWQGRPPLIVDMRAVADDDHVLAVYYRDGRRGGKVGAIAKSNCVGLRFREPLYRDLRELIMSYFELYFNTESDKSLRSYSAPLDLGRLDSLSWRTSSERLEEVVVRLDRARHYELLSKREVAALHPVDDRSYHAGLLGANPAGLYGADKLKPRPAE